MLQKLLSILLVILSVMTIMSAIIITDFQHLWL
jgi:hypothetical protein